MITWDHQLILFTVITIIKLISKKLYIILKNNIYYKFRLADIIVIAYEHKLMISRIAFILLSSRLNGNIIRINVCLKTRKHYSLSIMFTLHLVLYTLDPSDRTTNAVTCVCITSIVSPYSSVKWFCIIKQQMKLIK